MKGCRGFHGLVAIIALTTVLSGCASSSLSAWMPSRASFGVRPDLSMDPSDEVKNACRDAHASGALDEYRACLAFNSVVEYSVQLEEAYRSRATQNRGWIYVAGALGLGTVAASGGLAAAGAASLTTLALLSISGVFAAGFFAVLDNARLADIYTIAANDIAVARSCAQQMVWDASANKADVPAAYYAEVGALGVAISDARALLESNRTSSATAAQNRAKEQMDLLKGQVEKINKGLEEERKAKEAEANKKVEDAKTDVEVANKKLDAAKDAAKKEAEASKKVEDPKTEAEAAANKKVDAAKKEAEANQKVEDAKTAVEVANKKVDAATRELEEAKKKKEAQEAEKAKKPSSPCLEKRVKPA